ncbi:MAG TPA: ATP-dependent helicase, partial [bacterium]|nr:ATP-dependent helicase [bacterium]
MDDQSFKQYRLQKGAPASGIDFKAELNAEQYQVVTGGDGPCLVLAGPGSGKTRTLVYRVAFLLSQSIPPDRILLLTFTNKAAREMLRRVELLLGRYPTGLVGGTFHHAGNLALRRYADRIGYRRNFTILDRSDSKDCLAEVVGEMRLGKERYFPKADVLQGIISFSVNSCQDLAAVLDRQYPYLARFQSEIERAAAAYQARKLAANSMDYDDLLSQWNRLLVYCPEARDYFQDRFRSILVDEYQDTNRLQFEILKSLAGRHGNLMVVGDDAQSIYSFRAAEVRNTLDFKKFFPGARIARLETNY